jgi:thiamine pyrophosphokinase
VSSHHFVRELQEPTLVVANGDACCRALLTALLEWCPYVLALDGAYDRLKAMDIAVDAVLGDFDSTGLLSPSDQPVGVGSGRPEFVHRPNQNKSDLQKGLDFLIERAHPSAHIIWGGGGRSDHFLAHFSILAEFGERISLNLIDDATRTFLLPRIFRKWYPGGTTLSLMPMGRADGVVTQNLVYPLAGETLELGGRIGSSNAVAEDGWVEVRYTSGSLLLMEIFTPE